MGGAPRSIFFVFFFSSSSILVSLLSFGICVAGSGTVKLIPFGGEVAGNHRRILHQPLFPASSTPPPASESPPSSPPPPDSPDQPFFPEVPSTPDQTQSPPPPASAAVNGGLPIPTATPPAKPGKKLAIAISVGIVTLGMLSALAFFLYRHKVKHASESQKLVNGGGNGGSRSFQEESRPPPSSFLYIGTVEPSRGSAGESNSGGNGVANVSPYHKLNSVKRSDRYRPSPELQPLPPLAKPPASANSPSALSPSPSQSSSEEESRDTAFYTPQGSTISTDDGYYTPFAWSINGYSGDSVPLSKRTSPRSRLATAATAGGAVASSPLEMKQVIIPSIKQKPPLQPSPPVPPPPGLENKRQELPNIPNKPRFSPPPPPPSREAFQAINLDKSPLGEKIPPQPPSPPPRVPSPPRPPPPPAPPPPPPPPQKRSVDIQIPRKLSNSRATSATTSTETPEKQQFRTPSPESKPAEEVNGKSTGSSEKTGDGDTDSGRPKLKPLHWDKVRASSDRATVWDQLKSSSFQ